LKTGLDRGVLPSDEVTRVLAESGYGLEQLMIALLPLAAKHSHNPISRFAVGAVALGMPPAVGIGEGSLYLGANFEFEQQVLSFSVHAEQSAVNNAWLNGEQGIRTLAVTSPPCGICRQFLAELPTTLRVIVSENAAPDHPREAHLSKLLPYAFGPKSLNKQGGLMQAEDHQLGLESHDDDLIQAALSACNSSYAPYTKAYAGVALLSQGKIYSGRYAENAAFNPSLLAIQSALAITKMQMSSSERLAISDVVLVERLAGQTSQRDATDLMLQSISPGTKLRYHTL
jgi:cytidine deaminase